MHYLFVVISQATSSCKWLPLLFYDSVESVQEYICNFPCARGSYAQKKLNGSPPQTQHHQSPLLTAWAQANNRVARTDQIPQPLIQKAIPVRWDSGPQARQYNNDSFRVFGSSNSPCWVTFLSFVGKYQLCLRMALQSKMEWHRCVPELQGTSYLLFKSISIQTQLSYSWTWTWINCLS